MSQRSAVRILGIFDALCLVVILVILTIPTLAAVAVPIIGTNYVINLGDVPAWIMAGGVIVNTWMLVQVHRKAQLISKQTDGLVGQVATMSKAAGKAEERTEVAAAKELVRTDAVADAEAGEKIRAAAANTTSTT